MGLLYVLDVIRDQVGPFEVEQLLKNTASQDGKTCRIGWGKDPGQAGKAQTLGYVRMLAGYWVMPEAETGDKVTRFGPASAQCRAGNVKVLRAPWNEDFFRSLEGFPDLAHDDDVDALAGGMELMHAQAPGMNIYELYRKGGQLGGRGGSQARGQAGADAGAGSRTAQRRRRASAVPAAVQF
jgi:predicted phage terminase large subunit-like protein